MKKEILVDNANVTVIYRKVDKEASIMIDKIIDGCKKVALYLGINLKKDITIRLIYSRKEFDRFRGDKTEQWIVGATLRNGRDIIIFSPSVIDRYSNNHNKRSLSKTILHELAHIYIKQAGFTPWWLDEGLACLIAGQTVAKNGKEIFEKLSKTEKMFVYTQDNYNFCMANGGYAVSNYITDKLLQTIGKKKMASLIENKCNPGNYNNFFKKEIGVSAKDYITELVSK